MKFFEFLGRGGRHRRAHSIGERLRNQQKHEVVTQLACGLVQDLNNLLVIIKGNCDLLLENNLPQHVHASVQRIRRSASHSCDFVKKLLAFARGESPKTDVVNIDCALKEMEVLLRFALRSDVQLELELDASKAQTVIDSTCLQQVVLNLVLNSRDAMPQGGEISVRTCTLPISGKSSIASKLAAGNYVLLEVSDNGCGIDGETGLHMFEPFFTTKTGHSQGLGLTVVNQIVALSGGEVQVKTAPRRGTIVRILLPDISRDGLRKSGTVVQRFVDRESTVGNGRMPLLWSQECEIPSLCSMARCSGF